MTPRVLSPHLNGLLSPGIPQLSGGDFATSVLLRTTNPKYGLQAYDLVIDPVFSHKIKGTDVRDSKVAAQND